MKKKIYSLLLAMLFIFSLTGSIPAMAEGTVKLPYKNDFSESTDGVVLQNSVHDETNGRIVQNGGSGIGSATLSFEPVTSGVIVAEFIYYSATCDRNGPGYNDIARFMSDQNLNATRIYGKNGTNCLAVYEDSKEHYTSELSKLISGFSTWLEMPHTLKMWADLDRDKWGLYIDGIALKLNGTTEWNFTTAVDNISSLYLGALRKSGYYIDDVIVYKDGPVSLPYTNNFDDKNDGYIPSLEMDGIAPTDSICVSEKKLTASADTQSFTVTFEPVDSGCVVAEFDAYVPNGFTHTTGFYLRSSDGKTAAAVYSDTNPAATYIKDGDTTRYRTDDPKWYEKSHKVKMWVDMDSKKWGLFIDGKEKLYGATEDWSFPNSEAENISVLNIHFRTKGNWIDNLSIYKGEASIPIPDENVKPAVSGELLSNGNLEAFDADGITPEAWDLYYHDPLKYLNFTSQNWVDSRFSPEKETDFVHDGNSAVKLTLTDADQGPYRSGSVLEMRQRVSVQGATPYQFSAWLATDYVSQKTYGPHLRVYYYNAEGTRIGSPYADNYRSFSNGRRWQQFVFDFVTPDNAVYADVVVAQYKAASIYVDSLSLYQTGAPLKLRLETDEFFYVPEWGSGTVSLTKTQYIAENSKFNLDIIDSETGVAIYSKTGITVEETNQEIFPLNGMENKKQYTVKVSVFENGSLSETYTEDIWCYNRPSAIDENGVYIKNGKPFVPVIMYDMDISLYNTYGKNIGVNVLLYSPVGKSIADIENELDAIAENGLMVLFRLSGSAEYPAAHPANQKNSKMYVEAFKDHPAIFAWHVQDEPYGSFLNPQKWLKDSYRLIRDIDSVHPVWIVESSPLKQNYRDVAKCVDAFSVDPYTNPDAGKDPLKYVDECIKLAVEAVDDRKPVYSIMLSYTLGGYTPTGDDARSGIYQSIAAGAKGIGFYRYSPRRNEDDTYLHEKTDLYNGLVSFFQNESEILFSAVGNGEVIKEEYFKDTTYSEYSFNDDAYRIYLNRTGKEQSVSIDALKNNEIEIIAGAPRGNIEKAFLFETLQLKIPAGGSVLLRNSSDNLIKNGSFAIPQSYSSNTPADWTVSGSTTVNEDRTVTINSDGSLQQSVSSLTANKSYTLEVAHCGTENSMLSVSVEFTGTNLSASQYIPKMYITLGDNTWNTHTFSFTVPENADGAKITLKQEGSENGASAMVKRVALKQADSIGENGAEDNYCIVCLSRMADEENSHILIGANYSDTDEKFLQAVFSDKPDSIVLPQGWSGRKTKIFIWDSLERLVPVEFPIEIN